MMMLPSASTDGQWNFYTGATVTESVSFTRYQVQGTTARLAVVTFANVYTLTAGTTYRFMVQPTTATNITVHFNELNAALDRDTTPLGTSASYVVADATPTFTPTTTRMPLTVPTIVGWDNGAGSGAFQRFVSIQNQGAR